MDLHFLHRQEVVPVHIAEIDHDSTAGFRFAVRFFHGDRDAVPNQEILLFIDLQQRRGRQMGRQDFASFLNLEVRYPRVQFPHDPGQGALQAV